MWLVAGTICQPSNKNIDLQHVIETVSNEFNCFFLIIFQVSLKSDLSFTQKGIDFRKRLF